MEDRLIKKLWHTNRKEFIEEFSILQTITSEGTVEHTYFEYQPNQELQRLSTCQIEEVCCTGLKDCTGKLIYEGDVVKIISDEDIELLNTEEKPIIRCYYDAEKMCFYGEVINKECLIHKYYAFKIDYLYLWLGSCKVEIIGNIFENPELLEVKDEN